MYSVYKYAWREMNEMQLREGMSEGNSTSSMLYMRIGTFQFLSSFIDWMKWFSKLD